MSLFNQMLAAYTIKTEDDQINASREIMQKIALAGLYRGGFFNKAAFYGGTCLRLIHGSERFSEDMDFSLLEGVDDFNISDYFKNVIDEFSLAGKEVVIEKKKKSLKSQIESAFLKEGTEIYDLSFSTQRKIKIKIEVDTKPPGSFDTEYKLLLQPFAFMVRCFTLPSLFAGKMHALLFRTWRNRVKGRDWYDLVWYVQKGISLHINHFYERAKQTGDLTDYPAVSVLKSLLHQKIENSSIEMIKADIAPFIKDSEETQIYSRDFFHQLADMIKWEA